MMPSRILSPSIAKEIRALLPLWLGSLAALGYLAWAAAANMASNGRISAFGILVYGGTSIALGALSIGHEYTHRTLSLLLAQPASRARLFLVKQVVVVVLLLILAMAAWITVFYPSNVATVIVVLTVLCGLCLAPLLTMVARNPLAGVVFTMSVAGMVWLPVDWLAAEPLKLTVFWRAMVALCAIAAVLGWRTFMRLEANESRGPHVHVDWSSAGSVAAPDRRQHPVWRLVSKELRLQQLTFVVFAIYVVGSLKLIGHVSDATVDLHAALSGLYSGILTVLIGSLASAEEREYGTLESQLLLPIASSTQWAVKVGVTLGLALLLAIGLPALIVGSNGRAVRINDWYACAILILAVTSLYISSLCSTGIRALLMSVAAAPLVLLVLAQFTFKSRHLTMSQALLLACFLILVLWFGHDNHRSTEREAWRIGRQVFVMTGCLALAGVVLAVL